MRIHARAAAALLAMVVATTLAGCVVLPPSAPPAPATSSAAPAPTPSASPSPSAAPSSEPSAEADGDGMPVLDAHGCSTEMVAALLDTLATLHVREGFLHPEVLEGTDVACALTRPAEEGEDFATFSVAVVAAGDGVLDRIDAAILATGLEPDPIVWGIYQTGDGTPVAFLDPMPEWASVIAEMTPAPAGAEDWVVVLWYEPVA
ncbi:hypothetical protein OVA14_02670 [Agrococcus sp. SL85]|uniref:hypothetical protein n=1 Tax=Agrococcus sp. SL85 TaxID=2995141 RepID=UPI00226CA687|nr:hypothetical protein [Agrococcus sp. SL85]WAC66698.1 hypothetical protein OVA14_02670 [Agrococcus sp. SL85]